MPIYCFTTEDGETAERSFRMGESPKSIALDDGRKAHRDIQAEHAGRRHSTGGGWPMECVASGVNASQAGDLRKYLSERGCKTAVTRDGDPIYTSPGHRRKALKLRGFVDKSSYC